MLDAFLSGLQKIFIFMQGKKTYAVALATILSSFVGWKLGVLSPEMAYFAILGALGLGSVRNSIK